MRRPDALNLTSGGFTPPRDMNVASPVGYLGKREARGCVVLLVKIWGGA